MNRRDAVLALLALGVRPLAARAQQLGQVRRIGFLAARSRSSASNPDPYYDAFVQGMRDVGYTEGKNLLIDWRFADGHYERLPGLAVELVHAKVELIVTHSTPGTKAAQEATRTIPIVTAAVDDPIVSGFAASLARPGGNITGLSTINIDLSPKFIELLKIVVPKLSKVAFLMNPGTSTSPALLKSVQAAAQTIGASVLPVAARNPEEIARGFIAMRQERADAAIILGDTYFIAQRRKIAELALQAHMPTMFPYREQVAAGGLMSYGQNLADFYRRAATYVDKILKGTKAGDLPFEQSTRLHLAINRKTARALGLTIPQELLLRADEVIE